MAASVAVVHERDVGAGLALVKRHPQRIENQGGAHVAGELPDRLGGLIHEYTRAA